MNSSTTILDHAALLSEETRCRLLHLLSAGEMRVSELCEAMALPQSTVSRHLKTLMQGGFIKARAEGTSHFYRFSPEQVSPASQKLWGLLAAATSGTQPLVRDRARLREVLDRRPERSRAFFSREGKKWNALREDLFGVGFDLMALPALFDPGMAVGDLACGAGNVAEAIAPFVSRVIAVDASETMIEAARARLARSDNVEIRRGNLEALPMEDACLDAALIVLALHHVAEPSRVFLEARRILRPGGRLLLVDMAAHDREEFRRRLGHVWLGFHEEQILGFLSEAGFTHGTFVLLPKPRRAKGPRLFAVRAAAPRDEKKEK